MSAAPWLERTELLIGGEALARLRDAHVLVAGLGGVGSWAAEMLVRGGVGALTIVDGDVVQASNRNRQLPALLSTEGRPKTEVMAARLRDINPDVRLECITEFLRDERLVEVVSRPYAYVVDAIDTLSPKVFLLRHALLAGQRIVSAMGAGGKTDPLAPRIDDIEQSHDCRLAKTVRKRLHRLGVRGGFTVVYSPQTVDRTRLVRTDGDHFKKSTVGTVSYMPALFGLLCSSVVIRALAGIDAPATGESA